MDELLLQEAAAATLPHVALMNILWTDTAQVERSLETQDTPYGRRQYVRTVFAMIEGMVFATKQLASSLPETAIDPSEAAMLRGVTYDLDDKGNAVERTARLTLEREIKFAFRTYARCVGLTYEINASGKGWQALIGAKQVRDRLMHPKRADDLKVSDAELTMAKNAGLWFREQHSDLQEQMVDQLARNHGLSELAVAHFREFRKNELAKRATGQQ